MATKHKGVAVRVMGVIIPLKVISEREVKLFRDKTQVGVDIEKLAKPHAVLIDWNNPDANGGGVRSVAGQICDANGVVDVNALGACSVIVDGVETPVTLVAGLSGVEGALIESGPRKGQLKKRNPKLDTGAAGVQVEWNGEMHKFTLGASQTDNNCLFLWSELRPLVTRSDRKVDPRTVVSLADIAAAAAVANA